MLQNPGPQLALAALLCATPLVAGGYAVFDTGARLQVERWEDAGETVRLYCVGGGTFELPASAIVRFEEDDFPLTENPKPPEDQIAPQPESLPQIIDELSAETGMPAELIHSVISAESSYDRNAVSPKGAVGLMQLMPGTARELDVRDARDPRQNVRGGTTYLKQLLERYAGEKDQLLRALAAYNAGPGKVDAHNGLPPYNETRAFVRRVLQRFLTLTNQTQPAR